MTTSEDEVTVPHSALKKKRKVHVQHKNVFQAPAHCLSTSAIVIFKSCLPTIANGFSETQLREQQQANHVVAEITNRCCHMFFVAIGIWLDPGEWPLFSMMGVVVKLFFLCKPYVTRIQ